MLEMMFRYRRVLVVSVQMALIVLANYLAFVMRFDGALPAPAMRLWLEMLPWLVGIRLVTFIPFRLYEGLWRYTSIWELRNIIAGVLTSTLIFAVAVHWGLQGEAYPSAVIVMDAVLLTCFLGIIRLGRRLYRQIGRPEREKRVLIYGAGDAGEMIVRDMRHTAACEYKPVGFIDDDRAKVGQRIHGVKVLGTRQDLPQIMATTMPHEVLVAIPSVPSTVLRRVVKALEPFKVSITTLPNWRDMMGGKADVGQIRHLAVEDLLEREPVGLEPESVRHMIAGKRVLVTGAGGSIGSELCRQIAALHPSALCLYERYENSLYAIHNDLAKRDSTLNVHCLIGDVTDVQRVNAVLAEHQPQIIFHAAAHKHVPLMEMNPCEAVKNNIGGTRIMAEAAARYSVERFILISTDKAVNPSSIMGATKRVAELLVQSLAQRSQTRFMVVRFGNVLGSNGSVVPLFIEQIRAGGPVTVTHPDMQRYFMLIPEAVHLVLHAASLGHKGAIYVLEMGEQIKVLEMARNLIRLAGFIPEEEIPITFVGLRPGEKLFEELVGADETVQLSGVDKIRLVQGGPLPEPAVLMQHVAQLEQLAATGDAKELLDHLCELVPTYHALYAPSESE
ncbi:MAG: polysaccharide biosynthesis protein [Candidatus Tectimicrobiota bacterium]